MDLLPETHSKNGTDYKLVKRNDKAAMYQQFSKDGTPIGYEVFCVKIQPEVTWPATGVTTPEKEAFPGNEAFGNWAWSYTTLEFADSRYDEITSGNIREKEEIKKEEKKKVLIDGVPRKAGRPAKNPGMVKVPVVKTPRAKFVWEGKEYDSKSEVVKIMLANGDSKKTISYALGITVQTVHAVFSKMPKNNYDLP